ncbi:hypothetical protein CVT25_007697 [Psilocybe cyanescens]|uniref:Uncharacterized protein n=1 Tax=Psilocybe cyanescens TaxID=93625 RepID=A0A409XV71_PSICY|nr:hypothetical protein CVT25_007697 [Psilocybe cyanescens]
MSTPDIPIPVNIKDDEIGANLNSSMLLNFLMGTMYLCLTKKLVNSNRYVALSAISVLYLLCFLYFIVEWYYLDWAIVMNGDTRESIFLATEDGLPWAWILSGFAENSLFIVSDGLLIWRCYHVWGQSFWAISAPLILLVTEFGLFVATMVLNIKFSQATSDANANLSNNITSALTFVSLGTTMITTFLIGYRIHSTSRLHISSSNRLFKRIVVMIIESATAYSFVLLLSSIIFVIPSFNRVESTLDEADYYLDPIVTVVAGLAPTVLVARIALSNPNNAPATITHVSVLQFGSQQGNSSCHSGNTPAGDFNVSAHTDDAEPTPIIELKRKSSVDALSGDNQV